ncbi:MAG: FKBP-type peptidyl-prolyl cis-trans isomerase N-terminal domain-containing protein [Chlamydiales bacterium]
MFKTILICTIPFFGFGEEPDVAKVSEAMGHMIRQNLDLLGLDFDIDAIVKGLREESEGKSSPLNEDECVQAIAALQEEKMTAAAEQELNQADAVSNGEQINDAEDENCPFPATDSAKHR